MDSNPALPPEIDQALARGWTILTANQRAARTLRRAFDLHQRALGHAFWEPPAILAWDAWLSSLWRRLLLEGRATELLLSPTQEHILWRNIIAADTATASLRPIDALAQTAAAAWSLLHAYRCRARLNTVPGNTDTRTFERWAAEFERRCHRTQYLTEAQLPETLRAAFAAGDLTAPTGLLLVGFDAKTPAQTTLLEAVRAAGATIADLPQPPTAASLILADAPDDQAEFAACAHWLRAQLIAQPSARLAVIVPSMETARTEIDRVFRAILAPELEDIAAPAASGPYEFSLGVPLNHTPLAATALDLLHWAARPLPLERITALLLSPHFATDESEHLARAELDAFTLRRQHLLRPELTLDDLYSLASQSPNAASLTTLRNYLRTLRPLFNSRDLNGKRTHAEWAATIHELLEAAGWGLQSHLDSVEFQTRCKWESALDELTTLDFDSTSDSNRVPFAEALTALERIASETLFAPESRHAPIQIMGPLESAGSTFDAVWFLRANDLAWPATPAPNPLLPWLLQRDLAMPGADPAHDTTHARRITERIAASAPTAVFSYARQSAESQQRPSPTLNALVLERRSASDLAPAAPIPALLELETFTDNAPIPPPPGSTLQGGASVLRSQAACGFRAFAENRLFSSALDPAALGLDPGERGSLVHTVLENFWAEVKTQAALKEMPSHQREAQLNSSIDIAFARDYSRPAAGWPSAYISAERQRLLNLLLQWLEFEATQRPPFAVKAREEQLHNVPIGPLHLDIRVDRVDVNLKDGEPAGEIILDYKTGAATPAAWLGPRPDEPQLPLYAVVSGNPDLAAVAFASVRPGNLMGIAGYQSQSGILPKGSKMSADSLAAQVDEWREVLVALANDFHSGNASVSPKKYPQTCEYCNQRLLCRLVPSVLDPEVLEETEDADQDAFAEEDDFV